MPVTETAYCKTTPIQQPESFKAWIASHLPKDPEKESAQLLAHCEDGIVWGYWDGQALETSTDAAKQCPTSLHFAELRFSTLWMARVFNDNHEIRLWRTGTQWYSAVICDTDIAADIIKEEQIVWGTTICSTVALKNNWTLMSDGSQGLHQWVPLAIKEKGIKENSRPLRLEIHHSIGYDHKGRAAISHSRLVQLHTTAQETKS